MSRKVVMVRLPPYTYVKVDPKALEVLVNSPMYDYSYDYKLFHRAKDNTYDVRVVEDDTVYDATLEDAIKLKLEIE